VRVSPCFAAAGLTSLRHPGPPPRGWRAASAVILAATLVSIVLMLLVGTAVHGKTGYFFREGKAGTYLSFALLFASAVVSALVATRFRGEPFARFWWTSAGLFAYMGCDDLFVIHESLDRGAHFLLGLDPEHPVTDHLDDVIVSTYGLVALVLSWRFRLDLLRLPFMVLTMIPAFCTFLIMLFLDWRHAPKAIEDSFKILSGALILIGFLAAWLDSPTPRRGDSPTAGSRASR
jgi:hypothetical protein